MFNTLIGSPVDRRHTKNDLEFTPLGQESRHRGLISKKSSVMRSNRDNILRNKEMNPMNKSPFKNRLNGGSSFFDESEYDTIHQSATKSTHIQTQRKSSSPIQNDFSKHDLLNNGSNPVRQQQNSIQKLKDENYNLKLERANLTRFVNSMANDQQYEIYKQNSELQEQIIRMRGELLSLKKELEESKSSQHSQIPAENPTNADHLEKEVKHLNEIIERSKADHQSREQQLIEDIHSLQQELKVTLRDLDAANEQYSPNADAVYQETISEMAGEIEDRDAEIRDKENLIDEYFDKISMLEDKVRELQKSNKNDISIEGGKISEYKYLLEQKEDTIKKLTEVINSKKEKFSDIREDLLKAQLALENAESEKNDLSHQLKSYQKRISILESQLSTLQKADGSSNQELNNLRQYKLELESENDRLNSKINDSKSIILDQKKLIDELQTQSSYSESDLEHIKQELSLKSGQLERELHRVSSERDTLKMQLIQSDQEIITLRSNNEQALKAYEELRISLKSDRQKQNDNKAHQKDVNDLISKIEELNFENEKLYKRLEDEKSTKTSMAGSYEKMELKSLAARYNELQLEFNDKENEYARKISVLSEQLHQSKSASEKNQDELRKLKSKIRTTELDYTDKLDDERLGLMKASRSKDNEIKLLQLDFESLKMQHENEVKSLKSTIERLSNSNITSNTGSPELSTKSHNFNYELYAKLNDKNATIKFLNSSLEDAAGKVKKLEKILSSMEEDKQYLNLDNKKLVSKLNLYEDKLRAYKAGITKLTEMSTNDTEVESLKLELKIKEREMDQVNKDFNLMKRELMDKYLSVTSNNRSLENSLDKISSKYRQLQNSISIQSSDSQKAKQLKDQVDLYKMKYTKSLYNVKDLRFVNSFMVKSIKATDKHVEKDIKRLQEVGIYPDYELISNKKPTLKVIFKFVVAAIRIKRKTEYSSERNKRMQSLKYRIEGAN